MLKRNKMKKEEAERNNRRMRRKKWAMERKKDEMANDWRKLRIGRRGRDFCILGYNVV
jgi:hypothetical protein